MDLRKMGGGPLTEANHIILRLVNPNLKGIGRQLAPEGMGGEGLRNIFQFQAPIEVAYWHLTTLIGKQPFKQCRECNRFFIHEGSAKFCLAIPPKTISRCKSRFNVRLMRARNKKLARKRR